MRSTVLSLVRRFGNKAASESFLNGSSSVYVEDMYNAWKKDPTSVHASWDSYFRTSVYQRPPALTAVTVGAGQNVPSKNIPVHSARSNSTVAIAKPVPIKESDSISSHLAVQGIIRAYQARGHLVAQIDPLGLMYKDKTTVSDRLGEPPEQVVRQHKLKPNQMDTIFKLPNTTFIGGDEKALPLKEILRRLEHIYCRHIGMEFMHMNAMEEVNWIRKKVELPNALDIDDKARRLILARLSRSTGFEAFLAKKFSSEKRFGLEGCDIMIPAIKEIIDVSSEKGVESIIIGMPHRGRLNVLANVCRKPLDTLLTQFHGLAAADNGSGDVKYHLGTTVERLNRVTNKDIKIAVVANPSHLEAAGPVVQGKTRAEQFYRGDLEGKKVMSLLIHGDASFCGQGVVYETLHLSELPAYTTHGTIHLVVNNQIGFTTDPRCSRSSRYCTDVAKVLDIPIFHVNADDPDSVIAICRIVAKYRAIFKKDVVLDLVSYRRNGHNEIDEPMFTQPIMYTKIKSLKPLFTKYSKDLLDKKVVTEDEVKKTVEKYDKICEEAFVKASKETHFRLSDWLDSPWHGFFSGKDNLKMQSTGIKEDLLNHILTKFSETPPESAGMVIHKGIERILKARVALIKARTLDWSLGEAIAYGSLLKEGVHVRLSGQDVERGTFSHRHHYLHHQTLDKVTYCALTHLYPDQATYSVSNSSLSEYGVLGFEVGYSMCNPNALVMWEGQFGDFANTAQCIIDQFVSSGQTKWVRQSGIVLQLPHGMEGMGPEHSSSRLERFLQMSDDDPDIKPAIDKDFVMKQLFDCNWIVANCSTPGNLFHILRRQIHLPFRKPLILLTPKSLLKLPDARSSFDEVGEGTEFKRVIVDRTKNPEKIKKLIFCTGKVYYDMRRVREEKKLEDSIAFARLEQLYPFPHDLIEKICGKFKNAKVYFAQEEHKNQGAWSWFQPRFYTCLKGTKEIFYIGRAASASPATGSKAQHYKEVKALIADAMAIN